MKQSRSLSLSLAFGYFMSPFAPWASRSLVILISFKAIPIFILIFLLDYPDDCCSKKCIALVHHHRPSPNTHLDYLARNFFKFMFIFLRQIRHFKFQKIDIFVNYFNP
jgi:hypothetical protein